MIHFFLLAINKLCDLSRVVQWVVVECALLHNDTGMPCPFKGRKMFCAGQRYTYRVLQTIQMKLIFLWVWAERAVLGRAKPALKFKYDI